MIDGEKLKGKILEYHAAGLCGDDTKDNILEMLRDCQIDARIEAAIRYLRKESWAFGLPQEENKGSVVRGTWKPEDFGL